MRKKMHDPMTLAFEIKSPFKNSKGYRNTLIDIWHVDPETDGTDDSCGWSFPKVDQELYRAVRRALETEFDDYFTNTGNPKFSAIGLLVDMYRRALWAVFEKKRVSDPRSHIAKYMKNHLYDIINFAENPVDSLSDSLTGKRHKGDKGSFCSEMASIITRDILRNLRPWYRHPRWHVHHWKINFVWWRENVTRRWFTKCSICGKRGGFHKKAPIADWSGGNLRHQQCDSSFKTMTPSNQSPLI